MAPRAGFLRGAITAQAPAADGGPGLTPGTTSRERTGVSVSTVTFAVERAELLGYAPLLKSTVQEMTDLI